MTASAPLCAICHKRRPKRRCPGVGGDICAICCGTEREVTVRCPLACGWLQESYAHQRTDKPLPPSRPNADIRVDEGFLQRNEPLLILVAASLARGALTTEGVVDSDVREALDALIRTWRTLQSGLVYEQKPANPLAAKVGDSVQDAVRQIRGHLEPHGETIRDADILGILVFLQNTALQLDNGRLRGRPFISFLTGFLPPPDDPADSESGEGPGGIVMTG